MNAKLPSGTYKYHAYAPTGKMNTGESSTHIVVIIPISCDGLSLMPKRERIVMIFQADRHMTHE